jgi:hypothetical protein
MAATTLANVIIPDVFNPYVIERTAELSALWTSGIVANVDGVDLGDVNSQQGGKTIHMPFWQDLTGADQILTTGADLTVANITAAQDIAVLNGRALVYGAKDLVAAIAGSDPMTAIGDLMAGAWARRFQQVLLNVLAGAFGAMAAESPAYGTLNIASLSGAAANIDADSMIDAMGILGDAEGALSGILMHSATLRSLKKQNLIDFIPDSRGEVEIPTYLGKRVIVDDGAPLSGSTYTTYIFGPGAIGYSEGTPKVPSEVERNALIGGGEEYLVSRRHFVLHPRGVAWTGSSAADTPTNAELATANKWTRRWEKKQIRMVRFTHKVG